MSESLPEGQSSEPGRAGATPSPRAGAVAPWGTGRQWLGAALVGLILGTAAAAAHYIQTPQKYTVSAALQIASFDPILVEKDNRTREIEYRRDQAALLRSRPVILKALEDKKIADASLLRNRPDPAEWLEDELQTALLDGGLLRVSLTGENPAELAATVNAITAAYLVVVVRAEEDQRRASVQELDNLLVKTEDRVRKLKNDERAMGETLRSGETPSGNLKQQVVLQMYASTLRDQLGVDSQLRTLRAQLEIQKAQAATGKDQPVPEHLIAEALEADARVKTVTAEVAALREQLETGADQPGSPAHTRRTADLKAAEERLAAAKGQRREPALKALRQRLSRDAAAKVTELEGKIRVLEEQQLALKKEVDVAKQEVEKIGPASFELELKRAEIAEAMAISGRLRSKREWLGLEMMTYKQRVHLSTPAETGAARRTAYPIVTTIGLVVAGFALGLLGQGLIRSGVTLLRPPTRGS